jgi:hypothetical protein
MKVSIALLAFLAERRARDPPIRRALKMKGMHDISTASRVVYRTRCVPLRALVRCGVGILLVPMEEGLAILVLARASKNRRRDAGVTKTSAAFLERFRVNESVGRAVVTSRSNNGWAILKLR